MTRPAHVRLVEVHDALCGLDGPARWVDVVDRPGGATSSCVHHHGTRAEACACGRLRAQAGGGRGRVLLGRQRVGPVHV